MNVNEFWFENVELRDHPWPGLNWVTTVTMVPDVQKARDLYVKTFGFVPIFDATDPAHPEELVTTRLRYRGANILLVKNGFDYDGKALASTDALPPTLFYIYVDDVEGVYQKAKSLGMTSLQAPNITFWGDLRARLQCPFGYIWDIAKKL